MRTCADNELDYLASYYIVRSLLEDGIIDKELFDKINIANARSMGTYPITESSYIRINSSNMYNKLRQHENELLKSTYNRLLELKGKITRTRSEILEMDEEIFKLSEKISYFSQLLNNGVIDNEVYNSRVGVAQKRISELRSRRKKLLKEDDDEHCIDELRQLIAFLEQSPKAIIVYDHKLFKGVVQRIVVRPEHLDFEIQGGLVLREAIAWN